MTTKIRMLMTLGVLLVLSAASTSSASAETLSPWFHLGSVSRPGNLHVRPGLAEGHGEVQELVSSPGSVFELKVGGKPVGAVPGYVVEGFFEAEPYPGPFGGAAPLASKENVQVALEGVYGAGNVVVEGGPGGVAPLLIRSVGADAHTVVAPLEATNVEGVQGTTTARIVPDGYLVATALNVGEAAVDGSGSPVRIVDTLPEGLSAVTVEPYTENSFNTQLSPVECAVSSAHVVECSFAGKLAPYEQIEVRIGVTVDAGAHSGEQNGVSVSGANAPSASVVHPIVVSDSATPFGVEDYALSPEGVGGTVDTQAGSHPFQLTASLSVKQVPDPQSNRAGEAEPAGLTKDLSFRLPAGLIGNPTAVARCTVAQFNARNEDFGIATNECPEASVVGVASVTFLNTPEMVTATLPLYNLEPAAGEPARFGFQPANVPVILDTSVRTGEDYGVTVHVDNIPQTIGFLSNTVTFWGVPGDKRHDSLRGLDCLADTAEQEPQYTRGPCQALGEAHPPPFLWLPPSCTGNPLETLVSADSWAEPHNPVSKEPGELMPTLDGCGLLPFASEIHVTPDLQAASTPSGLTVDVHVPQEEALNGEGLAPADVKNITVALPEGLQLNPSAADGLQACSLAQIGYKGQNPTTGIQEFTPDEASCPDVSKIANVTLKLPILPQGQDVTGYVYLAAPQNFAGLPENPFSSLVAMYLVAYDPVSGIRVKLPGSVSLSASGQITATFQNNPQAPFEDAEINFFGGERAPLATPARCGSYPTNALFEPWSNTPEHQEALHSKSEFPITSGPNGTACPGSALPFAPSLATGTANNNAGAFTPLVTTISRDDGQQALQSVTLHYPAGVSGILSGIPLCPEANANAGTCPASSLIGETTVSVGVGGDPFTVTGGKVYLTEKYAGAPFGLSIVNPAQAGPFDLQEGRPVVVRAKVEVDPHTAALTVSTGAIPTVIDGFPLQIKHVNVTITRAGFTFNPTNCNPMGITGQINSAEGASSTVSVPFQVTNCTHLKFAPKFAVSTSGKTSKAKGASLHVKLTYPQGPAGTYANIARVKVDLPKALPSRLTTLQKACTNAQFEANPSGCPAASIIGHAKAITPLIPVPLVGPAYFVSHGGEAFPSLIVVLQGYGVTLDLVGTTFISKAGITSSTFKTVPDAPVGSFELNLPEGKFSALAANGKLCKDKLAMPTEFLAQNGAKINESTKISVTGCAKKASKKTKSSKSKKKANRGGKRSKK
jgi:hypothetical protein